MNADDWKRLAALLRDQAEHAGRMSPVVATFLYSLAAVADQMVQRDENPCSMK